MRWIVALTTALLLAGAAEARGVDDRSYDDFAHGHCKRASCFARHPSGTYVFPDHYGHRHRS